MHLLAAHAERDLATLHAFLRRNPLGLLTTAIRHPSIATLQTSHIPWVLDTPSGDDKPGVLRGHIALANPQAKSLVAALAAGGGGSESADELADEVLVLFQEPVHAYVSPTFYVETKPATGKVVPTWDYSAVQVYGRLRVFHRADDDTRGPFLARQLADLSLEHELRIGHGDRPWEVSDAPAPYVEILKRAILGIELSIERVEGRFKMSQDKKAGDLQGVVDGFRALGSHDGQRMAEMVEERRAKAATKAADGLQA